MTRRCLPMALVCCCGYAQTEFPFAFDAVSVKMSRPWVPGTVPRIGCRGGPETKDPGLWTCENEPLVKLLQLAYDIRDVSGTPPWHAGRRLRHRRPGATGRNREQFRVMVQGFLAERFHSASHWETRETSVYDLVVGKGGPRVKESSNQDEEGSAPRRRDKGA